LMLCSDGLHTVVTDATINEILGGGMPISRKVSQFIARANSAGGPDNISCVLIEIDHGDRF